jgi:hypothetical protein
VGEKARKFCEYAQVLRTFVSLINNKANWRTDVYNSHRVRDLRAFLRKVRVRPLREYKGSVHSYWERKYRKTDRRTERSFWCKHGQCKCRYVTTAGVDGNVSDVTDIRIHLLLLTLFTE